MAYAFGQIVSAFTAATGTTITRTITYVTGERAFVWIAFDNDTHTVTVADTLGNTYFQVGSYLTEATSRRMALFETRAAITTGAATVTATFSATNTDRGIGIVTFTGLDTNAAQTSANNNQNPANTTDAVTTGNMTPTGQPAMVLGIARDFDGGAIAAGTGFTSVGTFATWDTANSELSRVEHKRVTALTAVPATWTITTASDHVYTFGVVVGEAVAPGALSEGRKRALIHPGRHPDKFGRHLRTKRDTTHIAVQSVSASSATTDGADVLAAQASVIVAASSATTDGADVLAAAVSALVGVTSATTDGDDTLAANVAPIVAASSATTDGADVLLANVSQVTGSVQTGKGRATFRPGNRAPYNLGRFFKSARATTNLAAATVSASSATTDGADVLAANVAPIVAASSAKTDGADVLASSVSPIVAASSGTTDGADVLAANVDTAVGANSATSATTDGADVLAAQVGPVVSVSSGTTDGADVLLANVGPVVGVTSATTDGTDIYVGVITPVPNSISASSATTDGADVWQSLVGSGGGSHYGKKKKYTVRRGAELLVFATKQQALQVLLADAVPAKKQKAKPEPAERISLPEVKAYAEKTGQSEAFDAAYVKEQNDKLVAMFEQMRDDEEVEALVLAHVDQEHKVMHRALSQLVQLMGKR